MPATTLRPRSVLLLWGVAAALVAGFLLVDVAATALFLVFAGILFGVALRGAATWLTRRLRIKSNLALALCLGALALALAVTLLWVAPRVDDQLSTLSDQLAAAYEAVRLRLSGSDLGRRVLVNLGDLRAEVTSLSRAAGVVVSIVGVIAAAVFVGFIALYLASAPATYTRAMIRLVPPAYRPRAAEILGELARTLRRWLLGRMVSMSAVGVATTIGLALLGIPLAVTLGVLAGALGFVPNLGPIASAVPALLIAATLDASHVVYVLVLYLAINIADGYILTPAIEKRAVYLPPAFVISMQVVFGALFGVIGLMFATPLLACLVVLVHRLYIEDALEGAPARRLGVLRHADVGE